MIAGAPWAFWIGFHAVVAALLALDWLLMGHANGRRWWVTPLILVVAAAGFAVWLGWSHGRQPAMEFAAGYTIELSLSIDNLFVFMVLFRGFGIGPERQHQALLWGVAGAIVLRALFIATGIALLARFEWINWVLGAFLLYAAIRLVRGRSASDAVPGWVRNLHPANGSLLPIILAVELTDLMFAVDSIPAVLGVTHNPLVAYTSNIAAILGLRSLFSGMEKMLERFRYLHYGLAALLGFVAIKMLISKWIEVPITISLGVIGLILAACAAGGMRENKTDTAG